LDIGGNRRITALPNASFLFFMVLAYFSLTVLDNN
jgi:hypothetical protein